jgi:hypothetical protein
MSDQEALRAEMGERLSALRRELEAATRAQKEAVLKAEDATEKRFESVNEWRAQSADRERSQQEDRAIDRSSFILREVFDAQIAGINRQLHVLQSASSEETGRKQGTFDARTALYFILVIILGILDLVAPHIH